jgi:hypothetical protein
MRYKTGGLYDGVSRPDKEQDEGRLMGAIPGSFGYGCARETRPHGWKRE